MGKAALLFDLDGTMLVSDPIHMEVFAELLAPRGLRVDEAFYMTHIHGRLNVDFFAEFLPDERDPVALSDHKEAEFRRRLPRPYPSMPGAIDFLARARDAGMHLAVVTNAQRANAEAMLAAIGARDYFEVVVSGEETPRGKPHPDPYLEAMALLGAAPDDCVAFEDSPSGIRSAHASGAYTVGLRSSLDDVELRRLGAHMSLKDFTDPALEDLFQRLKGATA